MLLISHIIIALSSLITTTYAFFAPSTKKLIVSYILTGLTIATGTYLVITRPTHILQTCLTGLIYIGCARFGLIGARHKLAKLSN